MPRYLSFPRNEANVDVAIVFGRRYNDEAFIARCFTIIIFLKNKNDVVLMAKKKSLEEKSRVEIANACHDQGHPYESEVVIPYHPSLDGVRVKCSHCGMSYERMPTPQERSRYSALKNIEFTI